MRWICLNFLNLFEKLNKGRVNEYLTSLQLGYVHIKEIRAGLTYTYCQNNDYGDKGRQN